MTGCQFIATPGGEHPVKATIQSGNVDSLSVCDENSKRRKPDADPRTKLSEPESGNVVYNDIYPVSLYPGLLIAILNFSNPAASHSLR